jgi:hypothetical protein
MERYDLDICQEMELSLNMWFYQGIVAVLGPTSNVVGFAS